MRLSDLLLKKGINLEKPAPSQMSKPRQIQVSSSENRPQQAPSKPMTTVPPIQMPAHDPAPKSSNTKKMSQSSDNSSLYDSLPSAILQAAEQLEIPIPHNKQLVLKNARESLGAIFNAAIKPSDDRQHLWEKTRGVVTDLSMVLALDTNLARLLERDIDSNPTAQLISHSINTALIAMDMAKEIKRIEFTAQEIGAAAVLHDIGIAATGLSLEADENGPDFQQHVNKGVEILEELKVPESIRTMVSQHHERLDGQGYPNGISGKDFLISSQVLALAESFERIMADSFEENHSGTSQQNYVQATLDNFHKALDPDILKTFISIRGFYPNGVMIELTNRSICLVIRQNEGFPLRPVVQVVLDSSGNHPDTARIIDLRSNNTLSIIKAVTYNLEQ